MFKVQSKQCATCIYRKDSPLDLKKLEDQIRDPHIGFKGHRICHHSKDACCRGFWDRHKDEFTAGQLAQRLNCVEYVTVNILHKGAPMKRAVAIRPYQWTADLGVHVGLQSPPPGVYDELRTAVGHPDNNYALGTLLRQVDALSTVNWNKLGHASQTWVNSSVRLMNKRTDDKKNNHRTRSAIPRSKQGCEHQQLEWNGIGVYQCKECGSKFAVAPYVEPPVRPEAPPANDVLGMTVGQLADELAKVPDKSKRVRICLNAHGDADLWADVTSCGEEDNPPIFYMDAGEQLDDNEDDVD